MKMVLVCKQVYSMYLLRALKMYCSFEDCYFLFTSGFLLVVHNTIGKSVYYYFKITNFAEKKTILNYLNLVFT